MHSARQKQQTQTMQHAKQSKYFESTRGTRPIVGGWNAHRRSAEKKKIRKKRENGAEKMQMTTTDRNRSFMLFCRLI